MLNKLKILFLLVFLSNFFYVKSFAQSLRDDINQQDWIIRQQQNILEEKKRNLEFDAIKKERELNKKNQKEAIENQPMISGEMSKCVAIKAINFSGATKLSSMIITKMRVMLPLKSKCQNKIYKAEFLSCKSSKVKLKKLFLVPIVESKKCKNLWLLAMPKAMF